LRRSSRETVDGERPRCLAKTPGVRRGPRQAALNAYAAGWALSDGPMTPRVQAGCAAAILAALDHNDDQHVLEATLHIGKLEGTWARFFERREHVVEQGAAAVREAWTNLTSDVDVKPVVRRLRAELALPIETDGQPQTIASS
jgi:hypothetical protein